MLIIITLLLINAIAPNEKFLLKYRLELGAPISILDGLVGLGLLAVMIPIARNRMPTVRIHPLLPRVVALYAIATVFGSIASLLSVDDDPKYFFTTLRNFLILPASAVVAYFVVHWPKHAKRYALALIVAGVGAGLMVMLFYRQKAELGVKHNVDINALRTMEYGPAIAGIAAAFLIYQIISGYRLLPLALSVVLAAVAFIGQCATLSRSDWVAVAVTIAAIYFLLPKEGRSTKVVKFVLAAPLILLFIWLGIAMASRTLGIDFEKRMVQRIETLLPGERVGRQDKAWDTRLASQIREVQLWAKSPLLGNGFGHPEIYGSHGEKMGGYGHNTWTFTLFQSGPFGLAAAATVVLGMWVVGRRMIRDARGDKTFTLVGAMGACAACFFLFHGLTTASFNSLRPAIFLGLFFGVVIRARQMQLQALQDEALQQYLYEQQLEEQGYSSDDRPYVDADGQPVAGGQAAFGNWYQGN